MVLRSKNLETQKNLINYNLEIDKKQFAKSFGESQYFDLIYDFDSLSYLEKIKEKNDSALTERDEQAKIKDWDIYYYLNYIFSLKPDEEVFDFGSGNNFFKSLFKDHYKIITLEPYRSNPDIQCCFEEFYTKNKCKIKYGYAITSLHFMPINLLLHSFTRFVSLFKKNGRGFISWNVKRFIYCTPKTDLIRLFGTDNINQENWHITHNYIIKQLNIIEKVFKNHVKFVLIEFDPICFTTLNGNIKIIFDT